MQITKLYMVVILLIGSVLVGTCSNRLMKTDATPYGVDDNLIKLVPKIDGSEWDLLVLGAKVPVVVEFEHNGHCPECDTMHPVLDKLASEFPGKVKFYRVSDCEIAKLYGIFSKCPVTAVFNDGDITNDGFIGVVSKDKLEQTIHKYLF
ncbi:PREDICTED: thioredoxin M4, chloroplastic-like [Tarenaya hassleriana]|uniref:thioredoxin M4, chloroplastic-like n=1 Tax=Tarenaya hassleriana TaxID=28532 RepID=UPI00053C6EB4|nr:PREDICTED: thioredoxin M4, chloroplastic-like [Tarenaya hassleriana]